MAWRDGIVLFYDKGDLGDFSGNPVVKTPRI